MLLFQYKQNMAELMKHSALRKGGGYYSPEEYLEKYGKEKLEDLIKNLEKKSVLKTPIKTTPKKKIEKGDSTMRTCHTFKSGRSSMLSLTDC